MDENDHTNETVHAPPAMTEPTIQDQYPPAPNSTPDEGFGPPILDEARYLPMVAQLDIDETAQRELLETLWSLLISIAELGSDFNPVPNLFADYTDISSKLSPDPVQSEADTPINQFKYAASEHPCAVREES